jgi:hypothetical protein
MAALREIPAGYASPDQRTILAGLSRSTLIKESFFLVGGTALSVFYLGHRVSDDIDLFTTEPLSLPAVADIVLRPGAGDVVPLERECSFVSVMLRDIKLDLAVDRLRDREVRPLSSRLQRLRPHPVRPTADFDPGGRLAVDTLESLAASKLATLIGRVEPKDFVDYYFIRKEFPALSAESVLQRAKARDAAFDDPPMAAAHLREGLRIVLRSAPSGAGAPAVAGARSSGSGDDLRRGGFIPFPRLIKPIDWGEFERIFVELADWLSAR